MITNSGTLRWLKLLHIICAAVWFGCSAALNIMRFCVEAGNAAELPGYSRAMLIVDNVLIYWGVIGALITGLIYGFCTKWGFFRQFWIKAKWLLTLIIITSGTFITGPAIEGNVQSPAWYALNSGIFQKNLSITGYSGFAQFMLLLAIFYLSVKRPLRIRIPSMFRKDRVYQ